MPPYSYDPQAVMLLYLLTAWPYLQGQLQALELIAHSLEVVIVIFAALQMREEGSPAYMAWVMLGAL